MMLKPTHASESLHNNLAELKRRENLESLRPFCVEMCCFLPGANPKKAPITMEELKKLARAWKLHERRNFWKMHTDVPSMTNVLLQHIEDNNKTVWKPSAHDPVPPSGAKPSKNVKRGTTKPLGQIYGRVVFGRDFTPEELAIHSRFFNFPDKESHIEEALSIDTKAGEHHEMWTDSRKHRVKKEVHAMHEFGENVTQESINIHIAKHRNLAEHLLNYSLHYAESLTKINQDSINTFLSVSESEDVATASFSMIALSNISASQQVRNIMVDMNVFHKIANIISHIHGMTATTACSLLLYYFSCDHEIEDRVFNIGSGFVGSACVCKDASDSNLFVSMYTLSNLLPCVERIRVVELIMKAIHHNLQDPSGKLRIDNTDKFRHQVNDIYLPILLYVCFFSNTHSTLISCDLMDIVVNLVTYAGGNQWMDTLALAGKILLALTTTSDAHISLQVLTDSGFFTMLSVLLGVKDEEVMRYTMRVVMVCSSNKDLSDIICDSDVISLVSKVISTWDTIPSDIAEDISKYYSNICIPVDNVHTRRLCEDDNVPIPILQLLAKSKENTNVQMLLCRSLQNLLSIPNNCVDLCESTLSTFLSMIALRSDVVAALAVHNLACVQACIPQIMENRTHYKCMDYYKRDRDMEVRNIYLSIILQLFQVEQCIEELHNNNIIVMLKDTTTTDDAQSLWVNTMRIVLHIVNCGVKMSEVQRHDVLHILSAICVKNSTDEIIAKAAVVLARMSSRLEDINGVIPLVHSILSLPTTDLGLESISIVLYNLTCLPEGVNLLMQDPEIVNIMINLMRNGTAEVKQNIAEAIRTLCTTEKYVQIISTAPEPKNKDPDVLRTVRKPLAPLNDFIVIALLRASSDSTKVVCCQAFYNMLKHTACRAELLSGELYWAITRICKTECLGVLLAACRALIDASQDRGDALILRENHALTFIQEIGDSSADQELLDYRMNICRNLINQWSDEFAFHELSSMVRIAVDTVGRSQNIDTLRMAFYMVDLVALHRIDELYLLVLALNFFEAMMTTKSIWVHDINCCLLVSNIMWVTTDFKAVTSKLALEEVGQVLTDIYTQYPIEEINLYILGTITNYIRLDSTDPKTVAAVGALYNCIYDGFGVKLDRAPELSTRIEALTVLNYVQEIWATEKLILRELVLAVVERSSFHSAETRDNAMRFTHFLCMQAEYADYLLEAEIYEILLSMLQLDDRSMVDEALMVYASSCIRNVALHGNPMPKLINGSKHIVNLITFLVDKTSLSHVYHDIMVCFYQGATVYKLSNEFTVSSQYILDTITGMLTNMLGDEEASFVTKLGKYVISEILEKYSAGVVVEPVRVQEMFVEMVKGNRAVIAETMANTTFVTVPCPMTTARGSNLQRHPNYASFVGLVASNGLWECFDMTDRRDLKTSLLNETTSTPIVYNLVEFRTDHLPLSAWQKVVKDFPFVTQPDATELIVTEDAITANEP